MAGSVKKLATGLLDDPVHVAVAPEATTAEKIVQSVMFVPKDKKRDLLTKIMQDEAIKRVLVFTRTKHGANRVAKQLSKKALMRMPFMAIKARTPARKPSRISRRAISACWWQQILRRAVLMSMASPM